MMSLVAAMLAAANVPMTRAAPTYQHPPISFEDYPQDALRAGQQGLVQVRLGIDRTGRVSACTIIRSSGAPTLDRATCRLLQSRAAFTPARDRRGRPVRDVYLQKIAWRISEDQGREPALDAAAQEWVNCLLAEAGGRAGRTDSGESIADQAFAACPQGERGLLAAIAATVPQGATPVTEVPTALRAAIRDTVLKRVSQLRSGAIAPPPRSAPPPRL